MRLFIVPVIAANLFITGITLAASTAPGPGQEVVPAKVVTDQPKTGPEADKDVIGLSVKLISLYVAQNGEGQNLVGPGIRSRTDLVLDLPLTVPTSPATASKDLGKVPLPPMKGVAAGQTYVFDNFEIFPWRAAETPDVKLPLVLDMTPILCRLTNDGGTDMIVNKAMKALVLPIPYFGPSLGAIFDKQPMVLVGGGQQTINLHPLESEPDVKTYRVDLRGDGGFAAHLFVEVTFTTKPKTLSGAALPPLPQGSTTTTAPPLTTLSRATTAQPAAVPSTAPVPSTAAALPLAPAEHPVKAAEPT